MKEKGYKAHITAASCCGGEKGFPFFADGDCSAQEQYELTNIVRLWCITKNFPYRVLIYPFLDDNRKVIVIDDTFGVKTILDSIHRRLYLLGWNRK